ncbi:MAG: hypothetical protein IJ870_03755 [Alphaproteobacteria bacterium]|nr:hypothetical protein [Alphaproteobacteria bacterium]
MKKILIILATILTSILANAQMVALPIECPSEWGEVYEIRTIYAPYFESSPKGPVVPQEHLFLVKTSKGIGFLNEEKKEFFAYSLYEREALRDVNGAFLLQNQSEEWEIVPAETHIEGYYVFWVSAKNRFRVHIRCLRLPEREYL